MLMLDFWTVLMSKLLFRGSIDLYHNHGTPAIFRISRAYGNANPQIDFVEWYLGAYLRQYSVIGI